MLRYDEEATQNYRLAGSSEWTHEDGGPGQNLGSYFETPSSAVIAQSANGGMLQPNVDSERPSCPWPS